MNLIGKSYHIFNVSYTPEDYKKEYMRLLHESDIWGKFLQFVQSYPKKYAHILHAENCSGDNIEKAKNCYYSFHAYDAEDCRYAEHVWRGAKDCMDVSTAGREAEKIYEGINCGISDMNMAFIVQCWS
ncbi:MAG: hypothetical protein H6767_03645 [Candidatus Peribacteria bacterium]|nr:MAG: hypothetical protein H6767_03645 [Candidatus Peribacteria bacterium]